MDARLTVTFDEANHLCTMQKSGSEGFTPEDDVLPQRLHEGIGNGAIKVTALKDPAQLPWKDLGVDIALECTGIFTAKEKASAHLTAGAKRVLISAPGENADLTVVYGVNHDKLTKDHIIVSNASCTTNCLVPVANILLPTGILIAERTLLLPSVGATWDF